MQAFSVGRDRAPSICRQNTSREARGGPDRSRCRTNEMAGLTRAPGHDATNPAVFAAVQIVLVVLIRIVFVMARSDECPLGPGHEEATSTGHAREESFRPRWSFCFPTP